METIIAMGIVLLAAAGVGYGLYRSASGKGGCAGCRGCGSSSDSLTCATSDELKTGAVKTERKEQ